MDILISVSDILVLLEMKNALARKGYNVVGIAVNDDETLKYIEELRPDLVMLDLELEGEVSGLDLTQYINDVYHIPVVHLTFRNDQETVKAIIEGKPYGVLSKYCDDIQLYLTVELAYHQFTEEMLM